MTAYYNENEPFAAEWLRNLIEEKLIAPGEVDDRDIRDVRPSELRGFTQGHFFAGIGIWSLALRAAGWPDDKPVWTGSCPCQPFSAAGRKAGEADERHLWPHWFHLIEQCRPPVVFGEQVASKDGLAWLDLVSSDLEGSGHAFGAADLCVAGFGAPHIRQRLFFVAEGMADSDAEGFLPRAHGRVHRQEKGAGAWNGEPERRCASGGVANGNGGIARGGQLRLLPESRSDGWERNSGAQFDVDQRHGRPTNGIWQNADWLFCRDGKWRPVEPGTFPLVDGHPGRVGQIRAYGNAISPVPAAAFIDAYLASEEARKISYSGD